MVVNVGLHARTVPDLAAVLLPWTGAYVSARFIIVDLQRFDGLVRLLTCLALVTVPVAALESVTGSNPFFGLAAPTFSADVWAVPEYRGGTLRVEAMFGHPISYALFLSVAALMAVYLSTQADRRAPRFGWIGAAVALLGTQALCQSRLGWAVAAVGIPLVLLAARSRVPSAVRQRRFLVGVIAAGGLFGALAATGTLEAVLNPTEEQQRSSSYRVSIFQRAFEDGTVGLFGARESRIAYQVVSGESSIDSEFLVLADRWGLLTSSLYVAFGIALLMIGLKRRGPPAMAAIFAGTLWAATAAVALLTQLAPLFFLLLGTASALTAHSASLPSRLPVPRG